MGLRNSTDRSEQPTIPQPALLHVGGFDLALEQLGPSTPLAVSAFNNISSSFPRNSSFRTGIVADANDLRAAAAEKVQARLRPAPQQIIPNRRVVRREPHVPILREDFTALEDLAAELAEHHMQRCE